MSRWYRKQVGSVEEFAVELSFIGDPDEGQGATAPLSASWGEFRLFVRGREPTACIDADGSPTNGVRWYLLPLLEWLVDNWDPLLHETRFPVPVSGSSAAERLAKAASPRRHPAPDSASWERSVWEFQARHALVTAREGGFFPNVVFQRAADEMEVSWDEADRPGGREVRFVQPVGVEQVPVGVFAEVMQQSVVEAADALQNRLTDARLSDLWRSTKSLRSVLPDRQEMRAAWMIGLGRSPGDTLKVWRQLEGKGLVMPRPTDAGLYSRATLPGVLFASLHASLTSDDVREALGLSNRVSAMSPRARELARHKRCPIDEPFVSGYDLASAARERLGLGSEPVRMDQVLSDLAIPVASVSLSQPSIRGLSLVHGDGSVIAVNKRSGYAKRTWSRSAVLAHELCHVLFDRNFGADLAIASGPWAPRHLEQRANAFAVMFLMPEAGVAEVVQTSGADPLQWVQRVARLFGVSYRASIQHLFSLGILDVDVRDSLLEGLPVVEEAGLGDNEQPEAVDEVEKLEKAAG